MDFGNLLSGLLGGLGGNSGIGGIGGLATNVLFPGMNENENEDKFSPFGVFANLPGPKGLAEGNPLGIVGSLLGMGGNEPQNLPPGTISESGAMGQSNPGMMDPVQQGEDITVNGPAKWQPRKPTILGAIADAYLMSNGMQPAYAIERDARNVNEAMDGFADSPRGAIRRLGRIRGHEQDAWKLYNQYQDNQRADRVEERQFGTAQQRAMEYFGGMMGAIRGSRDPATSYKSNLDFMRNYLESKGLDPSQLPDDYDEDKINFFMSSAIKPKDQLQQELLNAYRKARLGQMQETIDNRETYQTNSLEERNRHNTVMEQKPTGKAAQAAGIRLIRDPQGNVVGKTDTTGKVARLVAPDGGMQYFEVLPNGKLGRRIPNELVEKPNK